MVLRDAPNFQGCRQGQTSRVPRHSQELVKRAQTGIRRRPLLLSSQLRLIRLDTNVRKSNAATIRAEAVQNPINYRQYAW
jgi:hypothetical protein